MQQKSVQLKASAADKEITTKIVNAGAFLDVKVLDHIILSPTRNSLVLPIRG